VNDCLQALIAAARLDSASVLQLPRPTPAELDAESLKAGRLLNLGYEEAAVSSLLGLFFRFELPAGAPYKMTSELHLEKVAYTTESVMQSA
jgi:hypothetical protein